MATKPTSKTTDTKAVTTLGAGVATTPAETTVIETVPEATVTENVISEDNNPTIETYTIAHAEDGANTANVEAVAVDVTDLSADKQATIQPINQTDTAKAGSYKAQWQLRHNGKVYNAGDSVELSEADAKALLETGVIVKAE